MQDDDISKKAPNEYICMMKLEHVGEYELDEKWSQEGKPADRDDLFNAPAADHPDWPYKIMVGSWHILSDYCRLSSYTNPDFFDM